MEIGVTLQTPILKSVRTRAQEIQEEHGHENLGETFGWLIDAYGDVAAISTESKEVLVRWMEVHKFGSLGEALQDLLLEFRDQYLAERAKVKYPQPEE